MTQPSQPQPNRATRRRLGATAVGAAGLVGGIVVGGTMIASAADPTPVYQNTAVECTGNVAVPPPATPVYNTKVFAGANQVSGTAKPDASKFGGVTPSSYRFEITTQYDTQRSGGDKTDVATVTVPAHSYRNPLLFDIPPVTNTLIVGASSLTTSTAAAPTDSVPFAVRTTGKATAFVTVNMFIADATKSDTKTVLGTTCPTGYTRAANYLQGQNAARPGAPTNVVATVPDTTHAPTGTAPNNGSAQVSFTKPTDSGTGIFVYNVRAKDLTDPNAQDLLYFDAVDSTDRSGTPQGSAHINNLVTGHKYTFTVTARTQGEESVPSAPSNQVTAAPATGTAPAAAPATAGNAFRK